MRRPSNFSTVLVYSLLLLSLSLLAPYASVGEVPDTRVPFAQVEGAGEAHAVVATPGLSQVYVPRLNVAWLQSEPWFPLAILRHRALYHTRHRVQQALFSALQPQLHFVTLYELTLLRAALA